MSGSPGGADGSLIATTRNADLQALGTGGQLVMQAWDQITGYLRRNRGAAHAALFAEPNPDPDRGMTDWYAQGAGDAAPLESLPQPAQDAARAELDRLLADIAENSATLRASTHPSERFLGELLALALVVPAPDDVRVIGTQPVLVAWGHSRIGQAPAPELLIGMAARPRAGLGAGLGASPGASPMRILGPPAVVRPRSRWPLALALASLPLLLALLLLWLDPLRWFQAVSPQCTVQPGSIALLNELHDQEAREVRLRSEIARLALGLGDRRVACQPPAALPAAITPPRAADASPDSERARGQGARGGRIQVILAWDDQNDLDLAILCPSGQRIYFENRKACGGELDVDKNSGNAVIAQPVENIVFAAEPAPGRYRIQVSNFKHNPPAATASDFRVTIRREGRPDQVFTGNVEQRRMVEVGGFDSPG